MHNFTSYKAGMEGVNKNEIEQIVQDLTKDSPYYKKEKRKIESLNKEISAIKHRIKNLTTLEIEKGKEKASSFIKSIESVRSLNQTYIHVDMDMFYAAVAMRDHPELKNKPIAVGNRSMISTSNYEARKYGVRSAMPGFIAQKLCPSLIFVKSNYDAYHIASRNIKEIFSKYDNSFVSYGLDEASLNVTNYCKQNKVNGYAISNIIRKEIYMKTKLTSSAGIAPSPSLAKIASDVNKPNGQFLVPFNRDSIIKFMREKSVRKILGVGKVKEVILVGIGMHTCDDIVKNSHIIYNVFNVRTSNFLISSSLGIVLNEKSSKKIEVEKV